MRVLELVDSEAVEAARLEMILLSNPLLNSYSNLLPVGSCFTLEQNEQQNLMKLSIIALPPRYRGAVEKSVRYLRLCQSCLFAKQS